MYYLNIFDVRRDVWELSTFEGRVNRSKDEAAQEVADLAGDGIAYVETIVRHDDGTCERLDDLENYARDQHLECGAGLFDRQCERDLRNARSMSGAFDAILGNKAAE